MLELLNHLVDHVQGVIEGPITGDAIAMVLSTGLKIRKTGVRSKPLFAVIQGIVSGSVVCDVKASKGRTTYYWGYSLDGKIWLSAPDTHTSKTTISGLTPGQTYFFRYHTLNRKIVSDFGPIVTFLVK